MVAVKSPDSPDGGVLTDCTMSQNRVKLENLRQKVML